MRKIRMRISPRLKLMKAWAIRPRRSATIDAFTFSEPDRTRQKRRGEADFAHSAANTAVGG
jgi:hypothetical protein